MRTPLGITITWLLAFIVWTDPVVAAGAEGDPARWLDDWPRDLQALRAGITSTSEADGTCIYELHFRDRDQFETFWKRLTETKSPGSPLVLHGPPDSVGAVGPAVRYVVRRRAVWPGPKTSFCVAPSAAASSPAGIPGAATARDELPYLKMPPYTRLWVEVDVVVDGQVIDLNRVRLPAGTPVFDRRIVGPYVYGIPEFDPAAVNPPEGPDTLPEVRSALAQLRVGMTRRDVQAVLPTYDERRQGAWTTYYAGTQTRVQIAYDERAGDNRPDNRVTSIEVDPTPDPTASFRARPSSQRRQELLHALAIARDKVRQVAVPGATRADVEQSLIRQDSGLQSFQQVRYYLGPGAVAGVPPGVDDIKAEVEYDKTGGPNDPANLVLELPQVYFEPHAFD